MGVGESDPLLSAPRCDYEVVLVQCVRGLRLRAQVQLVPRMSFSPKSKPISIMWSFLFFQLFFNCGKSRMI